MDEHRVGRNGHGLVAKVLCRHSLHQAAGGSLEAHGLGDWNESLAWGRQDFRVAAGHPLPRDAIADSCRRSVAHGDHDARPVDSQGEREGKHPEHAATGVDVHEVDAGRFDLDEDVISLWLRGWSLFHAEHLRATVVRRSDDSHCWPSLAQVVGLWAGQPALALWAGRILQAGRRLDLDTQPGESKFIDAYAGPRRIRRRCEEPLLDLGENLKVGIDVK